MTPDDLARRINAADSPVAVLYVAGGGTEVFPMLLAKGGGSATLLSARIPYDPADFLALLGGNPGRLVSPRAARGLAMAAYRHGLSIRGDRPASAVFGLGATSKLSRGPGEREGRSHEIHAAIQSDRVTFSRSIVLPPGRDRVWEERINALALLNLLALGKGVADFVPLEHDGYAVPPGNVADERGDAAGLHPDLPGLLAGRRPWIAFDHRDDGRCIPIEDGDPPRLLLPGSFRPLHDGHARMAEVASGLVGVPCAFEISLFHPEKSPLDFIAIASRLRGFAGVRGRVYLTNAPTYVEKARLFPGATFVVGHDAASRIFDPRFYGGDDARDAMLGELESLGARLLIFGRIDGEGGFRDFDREASDHPAVSHFLARNTLAVPEDRFRVDVSSTEIRERGGLDLP